MVSAVQGNSSEFDLENGNRGYDLASFPISGLGMRVAMTVS